DLTALTQQVLKQGRDALQLLGQNLDRLPATVGPSARHLLQKGPGALDRLVSATPPQVNACKIRCHGDYRLGQVLMLDGDFILLGFEGEPTRTVAERRAKQPAIKAVAGMLRSFHYAAYAGLFAFAQNHPDDFARLESWAGLWDLQTDGAFMSA